MRKIFLFFVFMPIFSWAQVEIDYKNCTVENVRPYTPAPCDISGDGVQTNLFMIQVGAYRNFITPHPNIIVVPSTLHNPQNESTEVMYRYFIAAIFPTKEEADNYIETQNMRAKYCDAISVPFPFLGVIAFN